jgi:hypothetical protein
MNIEKYFRKTLLLICLVAACLPCGCKTGSPSQYVSPRVEGRVLDSVTRQPINSVQVRRVSADGNEATTTPMKGGELLRHQPAVESSTDGSFVMDSVRYVAFLQTLGWFTLDLSFSHHDYQTYVAHFTLANSTNTATGEPLIRTGDILLTPLPK